MIKDILKKIIDSYIAFECSFIEHENQGSEKRLLILRKDSLGDFIIFLPLLKHYRAYYLDYRIYLVVSPPPAIELSASFSEIDETIIFDKKRFGRNFFYRRSFFRNLAKKGFDVAIYPIFSREEVGDKMVRVTKAKETYTFKNKKMPGDSFYTRLIDVPHDLMDFYKHARFFQEVSGIAPQIDFPTININELDSGKFKSIKEKFPLGEKYVLMFPGASMHSRIWPLQRFSEIADYLVRKGFQVVISGSAEESELAEKIMGMAHIKNSNEVINLCGKTDLPTLAHVIHNSIFYFGSDTGPMHLSAALGVPTICIMGGGTFSRFFPYGDLKKNRIIFDKDMKCKDDLWLCAKGLKKNECVPCIKNISVESAIAEINSLLDYI